MNKDPDIQPIALTTRKKERKKERKKGGRFSFGIYSYLVLYPRGGGSEMKARGRLAGCGLVWVWLVWERKGKERKRGWLFVSQSLAD